MKITLDRINAVRGVVPATVEECRTIVAAVLRDVPDVEPFTFPGYPDNPVYMHSHCGTVVDLGVDSRATRAQVDAGECDCETDGPWLRIFVEKQA